MLTSAGMTFYLSVFAIVFIPSFSIISSYLGVRYCEVKSDRIMCYLFAACMSAIASLLTLMIMTILLMSTVHRTNDYRTIYSNKIEATVSFKTDSDNNDFIGGKQIKSTDRSNSGTLVLRKDDVKIEKEIEHVDYLGDVEKGSVVEKIEYSKSLEESKLFGIMIMTNHSDRLKIHLKKPASEYAKEKKDAETKKELKSLLESSK